ncbi:Aldehyde/histidinol dehydrogenase [Aspergillus crustosus]
MVENCSQNPNGLSSPIETRLFINGQFQSSSDGKTFDLINPFTRASVAEVSQATEEDGRIYSQASSSDPRVFGRFARLESLSTGKPVSRYIDAGAAADTFSYFAEAGWTVQGTSSLNTPGHFNMTVKQPYGVVACIIPWNVPMAFFAFKAAPALAAGNTVVLKSSEKAPLTVISTGSKIDSSSWFPTRCYQCRLRFGTPTGSALASHMDVRCLSFTGSSFSGQKIQTAAAASNMKVVHMELGGKSPALIFDDADLESAAQQTQFSIGFLSGQTCMVNSRIYVQESVAEKFLTLFKEKFGTAATLGNPLEQGTSHGPQVDEMQYERVKSYLAIGEKDGELSMGGDAEDGYFIKPTVFQDVPEDSRIVKEEVFGPVVVVNTFKTEEEAIEKANSSEFGVYASIFTKDLDRAVRTSKLLEAGTVGVNSTSPTTAKDMPCGGYKMSGIGREGFTHSLDSFLETKTILIKIGS